MGNSTTNVSLHFSLALPHLVSFMVGTRAPRGETVLQGHAALRHRHAVPLDVHPVAGVAVPCLCRKNNVTTFS